MRPPVNRPSKLPPAPRSLVMRCDQHPLVRRLSVLMGALLLTALAGLPARAEINIANYPMDLGVGEAAPPLTMLVMGRDHTLYYEAYNDASDLDGDGVLDVGYKPDRIDYYGYFDSNLCYSYANSRFSPTGATADKKCPGAWSGDFLNYVTTARIDALRKVLYGGRRIADPADPDEPTILERTYIPQDAHSWGKEYRSIAHDGYDIADYTPLSQPARGTRHLFANTTLLKTGNKEPLMRVLTNSKYRIWEWIAIERPVAGDRCEHGGSGPTCTTSATEQWVTVPESVLDITQTTYRITSTDQSTGGNYPTNSTQFDNLVSKNATPSNLCGSKRASTIDGTGNPFANVNGCTNDYYLTIFSGRIYIAETGTYTFSVDGDDAVDVEIDGRTVASWYDGHGVCNCNTHTGTTSLMAGWHTIQFRHQEWAGGDAYYLRWQLSTPGSSRTDYVVRVQVCDPLIPDDNCKEYPDGNLKPVGLLQDYGESDKMLFGLVSGSFTSPKNKAGGVLRKNIESFRDEIDPDTGSFRTDVLGIVRTIDRFRIVDFDMGQNYNYAGGWRTTSSMADGGSFPDWGNPIGEMMYESLRYFSGKTSPTSAFVPSLTDGHEQITLRDHSGSSTMRLPAPAWEDPYTRDDSLAFYCSPGVQLVISDVNPSYDTDAVPGTSFGSFSGDISGLNVTSEAQEIWDAEHGGPSQHFIGQSGDESDGAPTAKTVTSLGNIRGLSPAEPTKQGGYYSASIARFGYTNDIRDDLDDDQNLTTFAVALASPLPRLEIPVGGTRITLVPFAKSVAGNSISATKGQFQPTDTIVDFFVESFANTDPQGSDADASVNEGRPYAKFRINFEDVEQGADHDMDAIVSYELAVTADDELIVTLNSEYAAGGITQYMGYVISGTTADGVYLEVRDQKTGEGSGQDPVYFLNTPPGQSPGYCDGPSPPSGCAPLPFTASRTFEPNLGAQAATVLENPLWYAAKYGSDDDPEPGETSPNYFLVTNAGNLKAQMEEAFRQILLLSEQSGAAAAASSSFLSSETLLYTVSFRSEDWSGALIAREIEGDGQLGSTAWDAEVRLRDTRPDNRNIVTVSLEYDEDSGEYERTPVDFAFEDLSERQQANLDWGPSSESQGYERDTGDGLAAARIAWLRGDDDAHESFRSRVSDEGDLRLLGDIINASPQYVGSYYPGSSRLLGAPAYRDRPDMIYIAANDGMLHGFNAKTGAEELAFVPSALLERETGEAFTPLSRLMDPDYVDGLGSHRYLVDGTPVIEEAYIKDAWRTILVGSQGAGGRTVFALDVTAPKSFGPSDVLWEFTDRDLGYGVGQPVIARLSTGQWAAIFGNGYNGSSQRAILFVVELATGDLIAKIDTGEGGGDAPNGLASPKWTHWPANDLTVNHVYAGDLQGHLWRFTLADANKANWSVKELFTATDGSGNPQPITARPAIAYAPGDKDTLMVAFGTGSYFRVEDAADTQVQTLYGIRDSLTGTYPIGRSELLRQEIESETEIEIGGEDYLLRTVSETDWDSDKRGWYLDLDYDTSPGERVISEATFPFGSTTDHVRFTTLIPSDDPCVGGREGFLYDLELLTGGRYGSPVFDLDGDGDIDSDDTIDGIPPSGIGFGSGERLTVVQIPGTGIAIGSSGRGEVLPLEGDSNAFGRQSWQQFR
ncbi:hypothetical protein CKO41_09335 [Thiococcus pfennigii]|nr:hypothetical protein [Thiococcus pfennigii]